MRIADQPRRRLRFIAHAGRGRGPLRAPRDAHGRAAAGAAAAAKILLVDDNRDALQSTQKLLEALGFPTAAAASGEEALRQGAAFLPEVALLDLGMPGMDGYDTARAIRAEPWGRQVRFIALTGWGQPEDIQRTRDAGFAAHLVKPLDIGRLLKLLRP